MAKLPALPCDSIFLPERRGTSDGFAATELARGPWHADTQHGGPMLALLAREVERHPAQAPVQVTRLTVDLMRAAPLAWVETRSRSLRRGNNVEVIEAWLSDGERDYARATAMRFRVSEVAAENDSAAPTPPPFPEPLSTSLLGPGSRPAFHLAQEMRPAIGLELPALWLRLRVPLVAGEETTPLQRAAAAADSTYSVPFVARVISNPRSLREQRVDPINPDTTLNLHRALSGEWIGLQGWSHQDPGGAGTAFAQLFDRDGCIGHSSQSILIRGPEARPESWREFDSAGDEPRD